MIVSVGIDIVDVDRMSRLAQRYGTRLSSRILGPDELSAYNKRADKSVFLAGRFAAKEAIVKAIGAITNIRPAWTAMQVTTDRHGRPAFLPDGQIKKMLFEHQVHISLSHERHHAIAVAVLSQKL